MAVLSLFSCICSCNSYEKIYIVDVLSVTHLPCQLDATLL
jgi:hypothetical protein